VGWALRPLQESDWSALRDLRLHALATEPGMFFAAYRDEAVHPESEWRAIVRNGFVRVGEAVRSWHDGATEEEVIYERRLGGEPWPTPPLA